MRWVLPVALMAAFLLPPGGLAQDPAVPAARALLFTGQGAGHVLLDVPAETVIDDVRLRVPYGDDVFGLRLSGPSTYFFLTDARDAVPPLLGFHRLWPGTYHAYAFGPPDRPFAIELVLGDLAGSATVPMGPADGRAFRLRSALGAGPAGALPSAVALDVAEAAFEGRGMVLLVEHFALGGTGATAILGGLHVQGSAVENDCIPRNHQFGITGGVIEIMNFASFALEPGAWDLGVDYVPTGALATLFRHVFGLAYTIAPGDPALEYADFYWSIWFGNPGLSSVPEKVQLMLRSAACTSVPRAAFGALPGNP